MRIYFDVSGRGVKEFGTQYSKISKAIDSLGHTNLVGVVTKKDSQDFYEGDHKSRIERYKRSVNLIKKCDVAIFEVSTHSISMGFLIQKTLESGKPVIVLHLKNRDPYFLTGIENDKLQVVEYDEDDVEQVLKYSIDFASDHQDTRFNFFISPKHQNYLDWIAKTKKIPRSVYLRNLIEKDMDKQEDYS